MSEAAYTLDGYITVVDIGVTGDTVIRHASGTIEPTLAENYEAARTAGAVVHDVPGKPFPDVTLRDASARRGRLVIVFDGELRARDALDILGRPEVFTLASIERPSIDMSFVVANGDIGLTLDDRTRDHWRLSVPFVEVLP
jgi:hypothetical protein